TLRVLAPQTFDRHPQPPPHRRRLGRLRRTDEDGQRIGVQMREEHAEVLAGRIDRPVLDRLQQLPEHCRIVQLVEQVQRFLQLDLTQDRAADEGVDLDEYLRRG